MNTPLPVYVQCGDIPPRWVDRFQSIVARCLGARGAAVSSPIRLAVSDDLPEEGFRIDGAPDAPRIAGGSPRGVLYGLGKFLRTSDYDGGFAPSRWRGMSAPQGILRGIYFANHFSNWYVRASAAEVEAYMEDLALWGMNTMPAIYPFINLASWEDPEAGPAVERLRTILGAANRLDVRACLGICPNNLFRDAPESLRAAPLPDPMVRHGNAGINLCPSAPGGTEYIVQTYRELFGRLSGATVDYLCLWPYDEGGCACRKCAPWGANGFLRIGRRLADLARECFPRVKVILSTWTFDCPLEGEWAGLDRALAEDGSWVDFILADSHEDYPRYPLEVEVPAAKPLLNFPEISMWGNWPWGGWGAHPLPRRFQRLWDEAKHVLQGGWAYSEGIYEDISKAVVLQFYWDRDATADQTLKEYIRYEFSPGVQAEALELIRLLEHAATRSAFRAVPDAAAARRAFDLAETIQSRLPQWARTNWRWELVYLRALLDRERYAGGGAETPAAKSALRRLLDIYHAPAEIPDRYHEWVRPPLKSRRAP